MKKELGIIESALLGIEDRGILTFMIVFDFGGSSQGFGGYSMDIWNEKEQRRVGTAFGCDCILRILEAVGVDEWSKLRGKEVWVYKDSTNWNAKIIGIEAPAYRNSAGNPFFLKDTLKFWKLENKRSK